VKKRARYTARQPRSVDPKSTIKITIVQPHGDAPFLPAGSEQVESNDLFKNSLYGMKLTYIASLIIRSTCWASGRRILGSLRS